MSHTGLVAAAETLAHDLLAVQLPRRWKHVQAVGRRAELFERAHPPADFELLVAAGFVHDIGYAPTVEDCGFHPVDGARHLRQLGWDERVVCLVAHHTCSHMEADLRGLGPTLRREFPFDPDLPHDELLFCDLTTGPDGEIVTVASRLAEVKSRYGPESIVHRFITTAEHELLAAAQRAEDKVPLDMLVS